MARMPQGTRKRSDGSYEMRFTVDGKRYSVYARTLKELKTKELKKREEIKTPTKETATVESYYRRWQEDRLLAGEIRDSTYCTENSYFDRMIKPAIGKRKLSKLTRQEIQDFILSVKTTPSGANYCLSILRVMCKSAKLDGIIEKDPTDGVMRIKRNDVPITKTSHRALTQDEIDIFFTFAADDCWYVNLYECQLRCGLRAGEAAALTWDDIYDGMIHVTKSLTKDKNGGDKVGPVKTKAGIREIPLTPELIDLFERQRKMVAGNRFIRESEEFIFPSAKGGNTSVWNINAGIKYVLRRANKDPTTFERLGGNFKDFSPHAFRDTYATFAVRSGVSLLVLKKLMGHSNTDCLMEVYAQVQKSDIIEASEKIELKIPETKKTHCYGSKKG